MEPFLLYALLGGLFTWGLTAVGAASVFFAREPSRKLLDAMLGFAAGVMLAASVFSLLVPGMEMAEAQGKNPIFPAVVGLSGFWTATCPTSTWAPRTPPRGSRPSGAAPPS